MILAETHDIQLDISFGINFLILLQLAVTLDTQQDISPVHSRISARSNEISGSDNSHVAQNLRARKSAFAGAW